MVIRRRDCHGVDPRIVAQMVEPALTERDLLVIINTEDMAGPLKARPAVPSEPQIAPVSFARAADQRSTDLQAAEAAAASVRVPPEVARLASDLGLLIVLSHRGIEARRGEAIEFVESTLERVHSTLMMLPMNELHRLME